MTTAVAGVPPAYFSADGQLWGNPLYRWDYHRQTGYQWWLSRLWYVFRLYDVTRIDHFRGFDEYFSIPADKGHAKYGHWEKGPGMDLFNPLRNSLGEKGVIAEDLGLMTEGVRRLVKDSGYPNMKVLQFAFDAADIGGTSIIIISLLCVLILVLILLHIFLKRAEPAFVAQTSNYSNTAFTDLVNKSIIKIAETEEFKDFFEIISKSSFKLTSQTICKFTNLFF